MESNLSNATEMETIIAVLPKDTNGYGFMHGGVLVQYADNLAFALASSFSRNNVVTAKINNIEFLNPIKLDDIVKLKARVIKTGKSSILINVKITSEEIKTGKIYEISNMEFVMVVVDENLKPLKIFEKGN